MKNLAKVSFVAALFSLGTALAAVPQKPPTYILKGYDLSGVHGLNAAKVTAKFKDKPGARITDADIHADTMIVAKELAAHHIGGHLFTSLAEKNGHVWLIFDVQNAEAQERFGQLQSQSFVGASHVSASALAAATGLKEGDQLSQDKLMAARRGVLALYAKSMPEKRLTLKLRLQHKQGKTILTWLIGEPE